MEEIDESGRSSYLVPVGAKRKIIGSQVIVEAPTEYVARRLYEMEEYLESRFQKIEQDQKDLSEELKELRNIIEELDKSSETATEFGKLNNTVNDLEKRIEELTATKEPVKPDSEMDEVIGIAEEEQELKDAIEDSGQEQSLDEDEMKTDRE